jgi:GIY-YIG catalytic domain.
VYALYNDNKLYYVGLASNLNSRLKHHLNDRHANTWDRFSVYLTQGDEHLREIEALLLRISSPKGNRQAGKLRASENLAARLKADFRELQKREVEGIFNGNIKRFKMVIANKTSSKYLTIGELKTCSNKIGKKFTPVSFRDECIDKIEKYFGQKLIKNTSAAYSVPDDSLRLLFVTSREYQRSNMKTYWYAFHPSQKKYLEGSKSSSVIFGCGSGNTLLMIPFKIFSSWLDKLNITKTEDKFYWHVHIWKSNDRYTLRPKKTYSPIDITQYLIK